jgi:hypothetical protein
VSGVHGVVPCGEGHHDRVKWGFLVVAECVPRIGATAGEETCFRPIRGPCTPRVEGHQVQ